jgi:hypothetical protein
MDQAVRASRAAIDKAALRRRDRDNAANRLDAHLAIALGVEAARQAVERRFRTHEHAQRLRHLLGPT